MIAHRVGCTTSTRPMLGAPASPRTTAISDQSTYASRAVAHRCRDAAKTGDCSASSFAIPGHCPPWPGKTNTTLPVVVVPVTTSASPFFGEEVEASAVGWLLVSMTARWGKWARPVARV